MAPRRDAVTALLRATDDHRRARIARRHGLSPGHRHPTILAATTAMTALHATEPSTPHLSLHARVDGLRVADVEAALFEERSLVRTMAMRRTLWVVTRDLLPSVVGGPGRRIAGIESRRLAREAAPASNVDAGPDWIAAASDEVVAYLRDREATVRELRAALPGLGGTFTAAPGTTWSAEVATMTRLVTILSAEGRIVRGHNAGTWRLSRPTWTAMDAWLDLALATPESRAAYARLVERWLWTFGPGTDADLAWWLGAPVGVARTALEDVDATAVRLDDGSTAWVAAGDTEDLERPPDREPWAALLPTLDPTTMGWRERAFYLDPAHRPYLFDTAGNAGTTAWVDGRIVGCWVQGEDRGVRLVLREDVPPDARRRLDREAERLDAFLDGERVTNVYASPQMRGERLS